MGSFACLYVKTGEPYGNGTLLHLSLQETILGRPTHGYIPDISILNAYVSRKHLSIRRENGKAVLYDLGSKHGTEVNGQRVTPCTPYLLHESDDICLANGTVHMRFYYHYSDQTLDFGEDTVVNPVWNTSSLRVDQDSRVCFINKESVQLSEKELRILSLLLEHSSNLVTIETIKQVVWPERTLDHSGVPDVGNEELTTLIHRIRKKLKSAGLQIQTIRGKGYIFR